MTVGRWLAAVAIAALPCVLWQGEAVAHVEQEPGCPLGDALVLVADVVVDLRLELVLNRAASPQPGQPVRCDQNPILLLSAKALSLPATVDLHVRRGVAVPTTGSIPGAPPAASSPGDGAAADAEIASAGETSSTTRPPRSTTTGPTSTTSTTSTTSSTSSTSSTSTSTPSSSSSVPTTFNPFGPEARATARGARPGLRVSGSLTPVDLVPGTTATARFVVTNATDEAMDDLVISSGTVDGAKIRGATSESGSCTVSATEFRCNVGSLTAGASTVVTANLLVVDPAPGGVLLQRAGATSAQGSARTVVTGSVAGAQGPKKKGMPSELVTVTSLGMLAAAGATYEGQRRFRRPG